MTASEEGHSESTAYAKVQERASVRSQFKVNAFQKHERVVARHAYRFVRGLLNTALRARGRYRIIRRARAHTSDTRNYFSLASRRVARRRPRRGAL